MRTGATVLRDVCAMGLEGIVAKRAGLDQGQEPGRTGRQSLGAAGEPSSPLLSLIQKLIKPILPTGRMVQ